MVLCCPEKVGEEWGKRRVSPFNTWLLNMDNGNEPVFHMLINNFHFIVFM